MDQSIFVYYPTQNPKTQAHINRNLYRRFSVFPSVNRPPLLPLPIPHTQQGLLGRPNGNPKKVTKPIDRRRRVAPSTKKSKPSRPPPVTASKEETKDYREFEEFSGSVFLVSPPPSSLPLPRFSLKPKVRCASEAVGGVDAGATDGLRRLLRM
ncbi:hypothetical protein QJS10_CPA03g02271 [Acorus calamus]|uniref:Uncharacterized protein n=1 Tax=Acorus calamus TaxID=4465 RepID=A0AAV9F7B7_ACOCL|nr:hypothetical protein QJS10_CPA03g02271 [Acorus calamus]